MEERDWHMLAVLFEEQNVTRTAEKLYLSQPAITYRLHQIEESLNIQILYRSRQGISFTSPGKRLVQYAEKMSEEFKQLQKELTELSQTPPS